MSPKDQRVIAFCAKVMGIERKGYDPFKYDAQAEKLAEHFGLEVKPHKNPSGSATGVGNYYLDVWRGDKIVGRYCGFTKNKAIAYAAYAFAAHEPSKPQPEKT